MAFGHGSDTLHCLTHGDAVEHGMHGGVAHQGHGDHGKLPGTHAPGCCGLYCLSALPLASGPLVEGLLLAAGAVAAGGGRIVAVAYRVASTGLRFPLLSV